jgi:hypothetical protein
VAGRNSGSLAFAAPNEDATLVARQA